MPKKNSKPNPNPLIEDVNDARSEMIKRHVSQLSEHFDSIRITGTAMNPDGTTTPFSFGSGDIYAQARVTESWLEKVLPQL